MHFWRESIDLIDSSWLVIHIMIWINLILIEPTLSESHLYMPLEYKMLFSVVYLSSQQGSTQTDIKKKLYEACVMSIEQGAKTFINLD